MRLTVRFRTDRGALQPVRGNNVEASIIRTVPRPNAEVILLLEKVLQAARLGRIKAATVITVNTLLEVESVSVGDLEGVGRRLLHSGLSEEKHKLLDPVLPIR